MFNPLIHALPEGDQDAAYEVVARIRCLDGAINQFAADLQLIELSKKNYAEAREQRKIGREEAKGDYHKHAAVEDRYREGFDLAGEWRGIGERDAVMALRDFEIMLEHVQTEFKKSTALGAMIDPMKIDAVVHAFAAAFPDAKEARHAAAHSADLTDKPAGKRKHALDGGFEAPGLSISDGATGTIMQGVSLSDGSIISTFKKRVVVVQVNDETLAKLKGFRAQLHACFTDVKKDFDRMMLEKMGAPQDVKDDILGKAESS